MVGAGALAAVVTILKIRSGNRQKSWLDRIEEQRINKKLARVSVESR
jgi:hypothetical protein